ncbi:MAG TPA: globin domain-containing protein, partial [Bryobacteraceae bacterium]|nr:globin domain-containing protein [Bryobacteraceae bacterium]
DGFHTITPALQAMGQRHTSYGVLPRHYQLVENALIWALGQALGASSNSEVLTAWRTLVRDVSAARLAGANQVMVAVQEAPTIDESPSNKKGRLPL